MISFDTNIAVHAANTASPLQRPAFEFLCSLAGRDDVAICELMLVELYLKLRSARVFPNPMNAAHAVATCQQYRANRSWRLIEGAPVMNDVWQHAAGRGFAFRRIIDVRLGLTLIRHGVTQLATTNGRDFEGLGFERVWNPL